jgi:hypothetical protein
MMVEEIQLAFDNQSVYRPIGKRDGKPFPLRTIFLTSEIMNLNGTILISYERVSLHPDILNPIQCFWCQKFLHS